MSAATRRKPARRSAVASRAAGVIVLLAGACAQTGVSSVSNEPPTRPLAGRPIDVRVEHCVDRTETKGRDLGAQATRAFVEKLRATKEFAVTDSARYRIACDVSGFVEGSAVKRWMLPGAGATVGQVSAMVTDTATGEILVIARGNATVAGGGLYTIGADDYIVAAAVDTAVAQLQAWARGEPSGPVGTSGAAINREKRQ